MNGYIKLASNPTNIVLDPFCGCGTTLAVAKRLGRQFIGVDKSGDMGIDGWIEFKTVPVQVKRWEHKVGRPEIDKFKTAIERDKKDNGIIVSSGYSKNSQRMNRTILWQTI